MGRSIGALAAGLFLFYMLHQTATFLFALWLMTYAFGPRTPYEGSGRFFFVSCLSGTLISALCGYCTAVVAQREELLHAFILAVFLVCIAARWSLIFRFGSGYLLDEHGGFWLVLGLHASLMIGGAAAGGYLRFLQKSRRVPDRR